MADPYIDNLETLSYGPFAVDQIKSLVVGLDPDFTQALTAASSRLTTATEAMRATLARAGELDAITYKLAEGAPDPLAEGRRTPSSSIPTRRPSRTTRATSPLATSR